MFGQTLLAAATLAGSAAAGTVLWDGRFNEFNSSEDLNNWSWANQVSNSPITAQSFQLPYTDLSFSIRSAPTSTTSTAAAT